MLVVNIIGITTVLIFLVFALSKKPKESADFALITTLSFLLGMLAADIWVNTKLSPLSFIFQSLVSFYIFPSLFAYGMLLMGLNARLKRMWYLLLSVALTFTLFLFLDFTMFNSYTEASLRELYEQPPLVYHIFYKSHMLLSIFIALWMLKQLKAYQTEIKNSYSNIEAIRLSWLRNFLIVIIGGNSVTLIIFLIYNLNIIQDVSVPFLVMNGFFALSLFYLSYNGIRQYVLANLPEQPLTPQMVLQPTSVPEASKYASSSLSRDEMEQLFESIVQLFEEEQIYHNPELKIQHLANQLQVTSHRISQTINLMADKPFYDFVNSYRIEYFKKLLTNPDNEKFTILALGMDSGFNSKASLNRIFKQQVGLSPRQFKQQSA